MILDPSIDKASEKLPVYPQWLVSDNHNKKLFLLHRISPELFTNKFSYKRAIVQSIDYFISLNYFTKDGNYYTYQLPNLFEQFDLYDFDSKINLI